MPDNGNFEICFDITLKWEGGFVDNPRDPGGCTNMGITLETLSRFEGHHATRADVMNLRREDAATIYHWHYWQPINGDNLPLGVAIIAFDICVNMGLGRILPWLSQTANFEPKARIMKLHALRCGFWRGLRIFNIFGKGWLRRETGVLAEALKH